ncbi:unnamed protein product [Lactuca virosa]|uniref:Uncharacterized protein n=1 Tax=Lactuca virosa TaxID=75947 RepID=A0AAU9MM39_9ASTR|nr:unnamed protein product [Lactuca virosa]
MHQVVPTDNEVIQIYKKIPKPAVRSMSQSMIDSLAAAATGSKHTGGKRNGKETNEDDEAIITETCNEDDFGLEDNGHSLDANPSVITLVP